jgi:hybrid cluster-associated redox disulfide protein
MAKITRDMTIAQILSMDMETARIFMNSGMHCVGCPASSGESLEQACAVHGLEIDPLLKNLNAYFENKGE